MMSIFRCDVAANWISCLTAKHVINLDIMTVKQSASKGGGGGSERQKPIGFVKKNKKPKAKKDFVWLCLLSFAGMLNSTN